MDLDLAILHAVNNFSGRYWALDHLYGYLEGDTVFKAALYLAAFWYLWFQPAKDQVRRREIFIATVVAAVLALVINRTISSLVPFRVRPMFTPGIGYHAPLFDQPFPYLLEAWSSFPSDQATYYFALATGLWLCSSLYGVLFTLYGILTTMLLGLYFGLHYPSDLLVGALLGIGITLALNREAVRTVIARPAIAVAERSPACFYGLMFLVCYEMGKLFADARRFGNGVLKALHHYNWHIGVVAGLSAAAVLILMLLGLVWWSAARRRRVAPQDRRHGKASGQDKTNATG